MPEPIPSAEQIETLRDLFLKKLEKEAAPCSGGFHPDDLNRINNESRWLQLFLEHHDLDMKRALDMLWDTCSWRKTYGANDMNESSIRMDYMKEGQIFVRNKDMDGKSLLIVKSKGHVKGAKDLNDLIKILIYWVERNNRETNFDQVTLFFDMQGAGLANLDLEFVKKIIETFKMYYPSSLNFIVIFEMAWILNAGFKIIKGLLPPKAVAKMKFLNTKTYSELITEENALKVWGGRDDYTFSFVPEKRERASAIKKPQTEQNIPEVVVSPPTIQGGKLPSPSSLKKVHFATNQREMSAEGSSYAIIKEEYAPTNMLLRISPAECIDFKSGDNDHQDTTTGTVEICSESSGLVTYKIKTTSPEKFIVRPSSGVLSPGQKAKIVVTLQRGHQLSPVNKDKFLVMCLPLQNVDEKEATEIIADLWKTSAKSAKVEQHRLRCVGYHTHGDDLRNGQAFTPEGDETNLDRRISFLNDKLTHLTDHNKRIEKQLKFSQTLQLISIFVFTLLSIGIVYILKQEINEQALDSCLKQDMPHSI